MWQGWVGPKGRNRHTQGYASPQGRQGLYHMAWEDSGGMRTVTSFTNMFCGLKACRALSGALPISVMLPMCYCYVSTWQIRRMRFREGQ